MQRAKYGAKHNFFLFQKSIIYGVFYGESLYVADVSTRWWRENWLYFLLQSQKLLFTNFSRSFARTLASSCEINHNCMYSKINI